jgi:hypothetical protein
MTIASTIAPNLLSNPSPRGTKRSRSPDGYGIHGQEIDNGMYIVDIIHAMADCLQG